MQQLSKPLPFITEDGKPFWEGCQRRELLIQQCEDCGQRQFPPSMLCRSCSSLSLEWVKASGKGTLYSYTVVHRPPSKAFAADAPYIVAMVDLAEGVRIMSNLVEYRADELKIGLPVEVAFVDVADSITLPMFKPVRAAPTE